MPSLIYCIHGLLQAQFDGFPGHMPTLIQIIIPRSGVGTYSAIASPFLLPVFALSQVIGNQKHSERLEATTIRCISESRQSYAEPRSNAEKVLASENISPIILFRDLHLLSSDKT